MTEEAKSPAPPLPREDDEFAPGELASCEEPDIDMENFSPEARARIERDIQKKDPARWQRILEIRRLHGTDR
jgi:hypothetical protein